MTCPTCKRDAVEDGDDEAFRAIVDAALHRPPTFPVTITTAPTTWTWNPTPPAEDYVTRCPCNPANGGNGVCGCILGGPQVTSSSLARTWGFIAQDDRTNPPTKETAP